MSESRRRRAALNLKAGEWVEVRSREEILATLDENGCLENLPFMPEMLRYCGHRFRVFKRADKTCDNIEDWSIRRMKHSVLLEGLRCDGAAHGGCQAGCLIFWKEAWLRRAESSLVSAKSLSAETTGRAESGGGALENVLAASQTAQKDGETIYSCQATELRNFTSDMGWWDLRQYVRDLRSGNLASSLAGNTRPERVLEFVFATMRLLRALIIAACNRLGYCYPYIKGTLATTPLETLDLQPGELVQVRSKEEIMATLDNQNRNRGLLFDSEMLPYCGGIYRVLGRVHRIIDEQTGKMRNMKYPCIVLEGVVCQSDFHRLCPRAIYSFWRESWLRRASQDLVPVPRGHQETESCQEAETCPLR
jgi:hypothetical protein